MKRNWPIAACLLLVLSSGCSAPPGPVNTRMGTQPPPPPPPAYVAEAVARFVAEHPGWNVRWQPGSGMPRLVGQPAVSVDGVEFAPGSAPDRAAMANAFEHVVATYRDPLGLRELEATFDTGGPVGNLVFLRGSLVREGVPVSGRVDCGFTLDGKLAWLSSRIPPGAGEVGLAPSRSAEVAENDALEFAGLGEHDRERIDATRTRLLVFWHETSPEPAEPALAYRVEIRAQPERDEAGGTYVIDAHQPRLLQFFPARRVAGRAPARPRATDAPPAAPAAAPAAAASERAVEPMLVRALVRSGTGADGATTLEPMPHLDVEWTSGGATKVVQTDEHGMLAIVPAPGDTVATMLTGGCVAGHVPAVPFTFAPGAPFDIVDPAGAGDLLDRASVRHWFSAAHARLGSVCDLDKAKGLQWLWCSYPLIPEQGCYQASRIYLSAACHGWPSWCFDTIILHEWAHAVGDALGQLDAADEAVGEALADIVAMFVSGQPEIGLGFDGQKGSMRSGTAQRTPSLQLDGHHHAGEPLVGFAWQVRQEFVQQYGDAGAAWADRLFLAQVALTPLDMLDFAERVIAAENFTPRAADAPPPIPGMVESWAVAHGLRAADAQGVSTSSATVP